MAVTIDAGGTPVPAILYGTAWKEDATRRLVEQALHAGFRGIDTANQRKHYHEAGVGEAIKASGLSRADLFLQTKFTFLTGQDHRLPYDPMAPVGQQVEQSFRSSLEHLGTDHVDSYVLHGPWGRFGLGEPDLDAWRAMEAIHDGGGARFLGISNVSIAQLTELCAWARIKPSFVQNRCYAITGWDEEVRTFCGAQGIVYQGFSLLTANPQVVTSAAVRDIATWHKATPAQVVFAYARHVGMQPLTGTTSPEHLRQDLAALAFTLTDEQARTVGKIALRR